MLTYIQQCASVCVCGEITLQNKCVIIKFTNGKMSSVGFSATSKSCAHHTTLYTHYAYKYRVCNEIGMNLQ